jgi:hypothetical protein
MTQYIISPLRLKDEEPSHDLSLRPNLALFFTGFLLPTELKLKYSVPIAGNNKMAAHSLTLVIKFYSCRGGLIPKSPLRGGASGRGC